ncbi:MAG: hypothetical protein GY896_01200 [Gammaproteobacteria bacterium]|nr:hypothetical protein [Gammaproteobacteria bacterium]
MLEVNAIYFILIAEGFVLLLIVLLAWILFALVSRRRKRREIVSLAANIKQRSAQRAEQTLSFLQAVYQLEEEDMSAALADIDKHEAEFFRQLVDSLNRGSRSQIASLDTSMEELIKSYKCMRPRAETDSKETVQEINALREENETLRNELVVAKNELSDLIAEFGEIFSGGKGHQLTLQEVTDMVDAMKAAPDSASSIQTQK